MWLSSMPYEYDFFRDDFLMPLVMQRTVLTKAITRNQTVKSLLLCVHTPISLILWDKSAKDMWNVKNRLTGTSRLLQTHELIFRAARLDIRTHMVNKVHSSTKTCIICLSCGKRLIASSVCEWQPAYSALKHLSFILRCRWSKVLFCAFQIFREVCM